MALKGRILYVVELDSTEAAVTWQVAELSKAWQTPVVVLGVRRPHWLPFLANESQRAFKRELLEIAKRLRALRGHVAGIKAILGDPVAEARRFADQIGAELIMIGAGEEALRDPAALSTSAFQLARRARQDVWICKPHADPHVDHVLCAADTSALAGDAVRRAVDLCRRFNARLRVLSVLAEPSAPKTGRVAGDDPEESARAMHQAQKRFLDQFDLRGVALSRAIVWGTQASVEVLLEAERYSDGLLVMGASSGSAERVPGLGATAEPVLLACASSMLIVRRRNSAERPDATPSPEEVGTGVAFTH